MLRLPPGDEPESYADWLEATLLCADQVDLRISDSEIVDALQEADRDPDAVLQQVIEQVRTRSRSVSHGYPFERDGLGFRARNVWQDQIVYSFLLVASLNQTFAELNYRGGQANEPALMFELLTAKALEKYLVGKAVRIGAPRVTPVPGAFRRAVPYLAELIREPVGRRDLEFQQSGDDNLDLWVFKSFVDERPSQLAIIAQCALGTDWKTKRSELDINVWSRHIDWYTAPIKAFAVPFHHGVEGWRETATRGGIVLDRLRIASLVANADLEPAFHARLVRWIGRRVRQITDSIGAN